MFVLKTLGKLLLGGSEEADLLSIEGGEVWKVQKRLSGKNLVLNRTKLFDNVTLVLKRENEAFKYSLYLKDQDEEELEELRVSLDRKLEFRKGLALDGKGQFCFLWRDSNYGDNDRVDHEFVLSSDTSDGTIQLFHLTLAQCLFETINNKPFDDSVESEIKSLMLLDESLEEDNQKASTQQKIDGRVVFKSDIAGLYVFDSATNMFVPRAEAVFAVISEPPSKGPNAFEYILSIVDVEDSTIVHQQKIDPDATLHVDRTSGSFIWCYYSPEGLIWTFSLRFMSAASLMAYSNSIGQAIYEFLNKESFSKVDKANVDYVLNPFNDVEMAEPDEPNVDEDADELSEPRNEESDLDLDLEDEEELMKKEQTEKNAQLAVGYKHDRSFVARGHSIGVFKNADDRLSFVANLDKVETRKGKTFAPSKMMLHQEDTSLLLMNPGDQNKIYKMDLDRGQVVEEWNVHPDSAVINIIPDSKYAQMTANETFIGINENSIFRIDPRLSGNKRVDQEMKQYVVKNKFSEGATTGKGELALGSAKGEIRLFDKLDKRAKTLLPGFGDPIIGIDVTESGKLIVATCKSYLLLINTEISDGVSGFNKSMASSMPTPKRLQLKPEHVAYMGMPISFTPARFNIGMGDEKYIITSTGPYVITWNLRRVKQGKLFDYQIKKYDETVVADSFRFNQDRNIVVTLPNHVTMITKTSLSTPSPTLFNRGKGRGKNDIVDSPY